MIPNIAGKRIALTLGMLSLSCTHEAPSPSVLPASRPVHSYRDLELREEPRPLDPATALDAGAVNADLDLVTYALEHAYSGQPFVPRADWGRLTARLAQLRDKPATVESLCNGIGDAFWQVPDAHLAAKRRSPLDGSLTKCGTSFQQSRRPPSVGPNSAAKEKTASWVASSLTFGRATVGVLSILRFASKSDPAWDSFGSKVRELTQTQGLVIDLRGNDGGDDSRGFELAEALLDGPVAVGPVRLHRRQSPAAWTILVNALYEAGRRADGSLAPFMQPRYDEALKTRDAAAKSSEAEWIVREVPQVKPAVGPKAFSGPIAILIDAACTSSCESSLEALRTHPRAKIFGQRSGGFIHFGGAGPMVLPTSHVRLQIPTTYNEYPNGKFYDKVGFEPDVPVKDGVNAFDVAMSWMNDALWMDSRRPK